MSDSDKMWSSMLANVSGHCEKQASVTFSEDEAVLRTSARICTQAAAIGASPLIANMGTYSTNCRDNDWRPYAEQLAAEQDGLARAIKEAGTSTASPPVKSGTRTSSASLTPLQKWILEKEARKGGGQHQ